MPMTDAMNQAMLLVLGDVSNAVAKSDFDAVWKIRSERFLPGLGKFAPMQEDILRNIFFLSGRWCRQIDGTTAEEVQRAIKEAIPLFG
jgi:hypothetical protein